VLATLAAMAAINISVTAALWVSLARAKCSGGM
jgi:hypothetical protein